MKPGLRSLLLAVGLVLVLLACKKDKGVGTKIEGASCKVDGRELWVLELQNTKLVEKLESRYTLDFRVDADGSQEWLHVSVNGVPQVGVSPIKSLGTEALFRTNLIKAEPGATGSTAFFATEGNVTVTKLDAAHIEGTFAFTLNDGGDKPVKTFKITDGAFNVHF